MRRKTTLWEKGAQGALLKREALYRLLNILLLKHGQHTRGDAFIYFLLYICHLLHVPLSMPKGTVSQICELSPTSIDLPHMGWLNCQASACELLWTHVSCICGLSCDNLIPPGSYNPSSFSSMGFLELGQELVCESMHLLPSFTGQSLSDDN